MNLYVIIVAGGSGTRMKAGQPKQFIPVAGKTILQHTLEAFHRYDPSFKYIVVLPKESIDFWISHAKMKKIGVKHTVVEGGKERFFSVKNALDTIKGNGIAAIHDGVRPLVSRQTLKNCFEGVKKFGNAVPVIPVVESVRVLDGEHSRPGKRSAIRIVQTPQCFELGRIKKAYAQEYSPEFTDDATVLEKTGEKIHLVDGNRENIKITTPFDIKLAEYFLGQ